MDFDKSCQRDRAEVLSINRSVGAHGGRAFAKSTNMLIGRNIMNRRTFTTTALLGLAVATALPQAGLAQSNPLIGTWKLNLAKSKYSPGPPPRSGTSIWEAVGQGL